MGGSDTSSSGIALDSTSILRFNTSTAVNNVSGGGFAIQNSGTAHMVNAVATGGTGTGVLNQSTGKFFDDCSNSFTGTTAAFNNNSGTVCGRFGQPGS